MNDYYTTLSKETEEVIFKDKGSKFIGYAFPVNSEEDIKIAIEKVKQLHKTARHYCYAWQLGLNKNDSKFRANDDGEPSNTAGLPIYRQIQSFGLTNVLLIVIRYFGGTKLGVSGLINAYKTTSKTCLETASLIKKDIVTNFLVTFPYEKMNTIMALIKKNQLTIKNQNFELLCSIVFSVKLSSEKDVFNIFNQLQNVTIKRL